MPDTTAPTAVAPAQATQPDQTPQAPQIDPEIERLKKELQELRTREGRFRNEKGVLLNQIRELQQMNMNADNTSLPNQGEANVTGQGYQYQPGPYQMQPPVPQWQPQYQDTVSREEWDMDRFRREHSDRYEAVRRFAQDPVQVQPFIRYRANTYGQAVPDVYGTYTAIAQSMELEELRKAQAQSVTQPNRNPALGVISGTSANSFEPAQNIQDLTPEQMREQYPEAFPPAESATFWGK